MNNTSISAYIVDSDDSNWYLRHWIYSIGLAFFALQLPIAAFCSLIVARSSLLHPNLKLVLITQDACFAMFSLSCSVQICMMFALGPDGWQKHRIAQMCILFSTLYGNLIGHILLLERILATVYVREYEYRRKLWFSLCWFPTISIFVLCNAYIQTFQSEQKDAVMHVTIGTLISVYISLGLSLAEIGIFFAIGCYNRKRYAATASCYAKNLSERYQLSENVRTMRQLQPTFLLHFANIVCLTLMTVPLYYNLATITDSQTFVALIYLPISLFNPAIELSVICCHPLLMRTAKLRLFGFRTNKVGDDGVKWAAKVPTNIDGKALIVPSDGTDRTEQYFRELEKCWQK